jgi:bifunctional UDP-N-acetylglucosamine pyrophosphorylase/glucosamine-1-phosphate N-acetyltransferase
MMTLCDVLTALYPHAIIHKGAVIAEGVDIAEGVEIFPYVYIGEGCVLKKDCKIHPFSTLMAGTVVGENTEVRHSYLDGALVGADAQIGPFAHLRPGTILGDGVKIGNFVETKNSTIGSASYVSHLSYIGDATVGSHVNIGAGTITANFNPYTGVKARTVIGEGAKVGANSVLIAPVTVEAGASVAASTTITKTVPTGSLAIAREKQRNIPNWVSKQDQIKEFSEKK